MKNKVKSAQPLAENDNEPMQVVFDKNPSVQPNSIWQKFNGRLPLLALAILALLAAMWSGLIRVGWEFPLALRIVPSVHGPLMITGFLGTLISLERAVALQKRWAYVAPLLNALGTIILVFNLDYNFGILIAVLGSIALLVVFGVILNRHLALYTGTMALGVVLWTLGNLLWLGDLPRFHVVHWWTGFLILTIVGERLELSRIQRLSQRTIILYVTAVGIFVLGLAIDAAEGLTNADSEIGARVIGLGIFAVAWWLVRYDIAQRTVRLQGLPRYIALCLLSGYVWLGVSGILRLIYGGASGGFYYDAILHAVLIGFIMSMIFGHAPIIFPSVLGRPLTYRSIFYVQLILLHLSLVLRVLGDLVLSAPIRQWGAMLNVIAILLFLFVTITTVAQSTRAAR